MAHLRATAHMRLRARDLYTSSTLIGGKEGAGPSSLHTMLEGPTNKSMWMQDGCKVYMDSYMASNGSCSWSLDCFKNHFLEVGLTQNRATTALRMLTIVDLFSFITCEDPYEQKFLEITFGWGLSHIWLHTTLEGLWPYYMMLEVCWDGLWTLFYELSQFHGLGSWLVCEVTLRFSKLQITLHMQRPSQYIVPPTRGANDNTSMSYLAFWEDTN